MVAPKVLLKLIAMICISLSAILFIFYNADIPNKRSNGFSRTFLTTEYTILNKTEANIPLRDIVHMTPKELWFSCDSVDNIARYKIDKADWEVITLNIDDFTKRAIGNVFSYEVEDDLLFLYSNNLRSIFLVRNHDVVASYTIPSQSPFLYAVHIAPRSFIIRQYEKSKNDVVFRSIGFNPTYSEEASSLFFGSGDLGLSSDGQLLYNKELKQASYMHYYNNIVVSFDTDLKEVKRFNTIDTISFKGKLDNSKPLLVTNKKATLFDRYILICSNLKADNEKNNVYRKNIPVDIYDTINGNYVGSFYLPVSNGKLIRSFGFDGNILAALYYDNTIGIFGLDLPL